MTNDKILFVDLLYSENGSFDDDFNAIRQALPGVQCDYLKCDVRNAIGGVLRTIRITLSMRYSKVIILSAKVSQLAMLGPLSLTCKIFAIYHFLPNSRVRMHSRLLPVLSRYFHFATYAESVSDKFSKITGIRPPALPSRIVDKAESELLLRTKFACQGTLRVLIPGVRRGVRKALDPQRLILLLQQVTGAKEIRLCIQGEPDDSLIGGPNIEFVRKGMPKEAYIEMYRSNHIVAVEFESGYEVRASGVILDAIASGCLVLTADHEINRGYGFPNSIICDIEHIDVVIRQIRSGEPLQLLIPGVEAEEFGQLWRTFLGI